MAGRANYAAAAQIPANCSIPSVTHANTEYTAQIIFRVKGRTVGQRLQGCVVGDHRRIGVQQIVDLAIDLEFVRQLILNGKIEHRSAVEVIWEDVRRPLEEGRIAPR